MTGLAPAARRLALAAALALAGLAALAPAGRGPLRAEAGPEVDLVLVLAVDCSYSVDSTEYRLQMEGIARAFETADVQRAIRQGAFGRIAVTVMQWSDDESQAVVVPWTVVDGEATARRFAAAVSAAPRQLAEGGTAIGAALRVAAGLSLAAPFSPVRRVIDISSDGRNNRGDVVETSRDAVVAQGITINALAVLNEWPTLDKYFEQRVAGGPYHFVMVANDYAAYAEAIYRKLLREITGPGYS